MTSRSARERRRHASYSVRQVAVRRVIAAGESPAASFPNSTGRASRKSPVDRPLQRKQRQHRARGPRAAHRRREDRTGELLPRAVQPALIIDTRGRNRDRPGSHGEATGARLPVADHQGMAAGIACVTVLLPVLLHFDLQGGQNHTASPFPSPLVQRRGHHLRTLLRGPPSFGLSSALACLSPACQPVCAGVVHPERYATFSPAFHNF